MSAGTPGPFCDLLREWVATERSAGRLIGLHFSLGTEPAGIEEVARVVYEVLTGKRACVDVTEQKL